MFPLLKDPKSLEFQAKVGEMVILWNALETYMRLITAVLAGGGPRADILTANLGNVAIREALVTLANELGDDSTKEHIGHFAEGFDRLREYRNWLAHSIIGLGFGPDRESIGVSQAISARARLALHQKMTQKSEIESCISNICAFGKYAGSILMSLSGESNGLPGFQPLSSQGKPPLPDRLQKPRLNLMGA